MVDPYPASPEPPPAATPLDRPLRGATMPEAFVRFFQKYAVFSGRASRSEFWWWVLANFIVGIVLGIIAAIIGTQILTYIWDLVIIVPTFALGARRLHDTNRSGWWQLLELIPIIGWIILIVWFASRERPEGVRFDV